MGNVASYHCSILCDDGKLQVFGSDFCYSGISPSELHCIVVKEHMRLALTISHSPSGINQGTHAS